VDDFVRARPAGTKEPDALVPSICALGSPFLEVLCYAEALCRKGQTEDRLFSFGSFGNSADTD